MIFLFRLIGVAVLAVAAVLAVGLWDLTANGGRWLSRLAGSERLVADCTPPLRDNLIGKGFTPVDIALGDRPSISFAASSFGRTRSLTDHFSFSDGQDGPRVDGDLYCAVEGPSIKVDVDVDALPRRVT